eukprot:9701791-Alexandrium_andersonii.AAC.1
MACVMFTCLGVGAARARGGGAGASWATWGMTCGGPPSEPSGPARRAQGAARRFWSSPRLRCSDKGRRAAALTSRTSVGLIAAM